MARTQAYSGGITSGQYTFAKAPTTSMPRSVFNRSHGHKTTFDAGLLVPVFLDEAVPGDTFICKTTAFARLATPYVPIMDTMWLDLFFFSVPIRQIWSNFKRFMGEQPNPGDTTAFTVPLSNSHTPSALSLQDYLGIPIQGVACQYNILPLRAYMHIFNEWFRSEDLTDRFNFSTGDGPDSVSGYAVRRRTKRHDYFTSCLPFTQKGDPVELPLGTVAPVIGDGATEPQFDIGGATTARLASQATGDDVRWSSTPGSADFAMWHATNTGLLADLSEATAATINDLRQAFQIQKLLERDARGGTRYVEIVKSHFGVSDAGGDARMQRPEYLGGGSIKININPVAATAGSTSQPNIGELGGFGTAVGSGIGFNASFTEHCYIIGIANVRAELTYQQGLHKLWQRQTRYDFYWPSLAHIGEQAVLNSEIYWSNNPSVDDAVFGYQERYAEYRYKPSYVTGQFRSEHGTPLDMWHLALDFPTVPALNNVFIEDTPPLDRCITVPSEPHFLADFYFNLKCARPMPTYSVPGLIDHF